MATRADSVPQVTPVFSSHRTALWLTCCVLAIAVLLPADNVEQGVRLPFLEFRIPATCTLGRITEVGCPVCGMTRGVILCAHGHWQRAHALNPLTVPIFLLLVLQIPLRFALLRRADWALRYDRIEGKLLWALAGLIVAVWLIRLLA